MADFLSAVMCDLSSFNILYLVGEITLSVSANRHTHPEQFTYLSPTADSLAAKRRLFTDSSL